MIKALWGICLFTCTICLIVIAASQFTIWRNTGISASLPRSEGGYTVEALAVNTTILEIVITLVGFVLAALALIGYTGIKNAAIEAAEREAKATASEEILKLKKAMEGVQSGMPEGEGTYKLNSNDVKGASLAGKE